MVTLVFKFSHRAVANVELVAASGLHFTFSSLIPIGMSYISDPG